MFSTIQSTDQDQASFSWIKAGFVLKIEHAHGKPTVTLFCFNAPQSMWDTLQNLKKKVSCEDVANDPYILLNIGLDEMFRVLDQNAWLVSKIFGEIETVNFPVLLRHARYKVADSDEENARNRSNARESLGSGELHGLTQPRKTPNLSPRKL